MWVDTVFNGPDTYLGIVGKDNMLHWSTDIGVGHDTLLDHFGDKSEGHPQTVKVTFWPTTKERTQYFHVVSKYPGLEKTALDTVSYLKRSFSDRASEAKVVLKYYKGTGEEDSYEGPLSEFQQAEKLQH